MLSEEILGGVLAADAAYDAAHKAVATAEASIAAGGLTSERAEALVSARALLTQRQTERDARLVVARGHILTKMTDLLGPESATLTGRAMATLGRDLPTEWRFLDLSPEGLSLLEFAWRNTRLGHELSLAEQAAVSAAESSATVALVRSRIQANEAAIREVFIQAMAGPLGGL